MPCGESKQAWTCAKATCTSSLILTDSTEIVGIGEKGQCKRNALYGFLSGDFLF